MIDQSYKIELVDKLSEAVAKRENNPYTACEVIYKEIV
jgi:hypothetical protein